jgi:hypothetical protein
MSYRYFAYGSTLCHEHVTEWAGEHGYQGLSLDEGTLAVLDDFELVLSVPSKYWMGAVGTLEPRSGASVYGVLFDLPGDAGDKIRHKEGVATGLYREVELEVRLFSGGAEDATVQLVSAWGFRAAEGRSVENPPPASQRWLDIVLRGAKEHGLPDLWLAELRRLGRRP